MMKKIAVLAMSLLLILCALGGAAAETETTETAKTEIGVLNVNGAFSIQSRIPEGYTYTPLTNTSLNITGILTGGEGQPMVTVSIAYNETYADMERFNDVDEATVQEIRDSFLQADPEVTFEDLETAFGTRLMKVTGKRFVDIYTMYKSYEVEFVMAGGTITDEDIRMMVDFISDMDFVTVE